MYTLWITNESILLVTNVILPFAVPTIVEPLSTTAAATFFVASTVVLTVFATVSKIREMLSGYLKQHNIWNYLRCIFDVLPLAEPIAVVPFSIALAATFLVASTVACTVWATVSNGGKTKWFIVHYNIYYTNHGNWF